MTKYYNKEIPTEIHFIYGGRHNGKTYREFKRLRTIIKELKEELEENKKGWKDMYISYEKLVNRIGKAVRYIEKCTDSEDIHERFLSTGETKELLKSLKGEENDN